MGPHLRFAGMIGVAAALHALGMFAVLSHRVSLARPTPPPIVGISSLLIDLEPEERATASADVVRGEPQTFAATQGPREHVSPPRGPHVETPPSAIAGAPESAAGDWSLSPVAHPGSDLVLGASMHAGVRKLLEDEAQAARSERPRPDLSSRFGPKDADLGLLPGNELVSVTRDMVRASRVPLNGSARLELRVDSSGHVTAVRVIDASSGRREWDELTAGLTSSPTMSAIAVRRPRGFADGLVITIDVTSAVKTVDGRIVTGKTGIADKLGAVLGAVIDPIDAFAASTVPAQRVVAARVVGADAAAAAAAGHRSVDVTPSLGGAQESAGTAAAVTAPDAKVLSLKLSVPP